MQVLAIRDRLEQLRAIDAQIAGLPEGDPARASLGTQRQSLSTAANSARSQLQTLETTGPPPPPLRTLEKAEGGPAVADG